MPSDTFSLRLSNHSVQLTFLLDTADKEDREVLLREATAIIPLASLKVLQIVVVNAIAYAEANFGPIVLPPGKEEELRAMLDANLRVPSAAKK